MMLLPIIIFVIFIIYFNPSKGENKHNFGRDTSSNNALDILARRFANGEISEEEYLKRKSILK